ncbi:MAG: type II toxin-antitoxin system VapC family toxin [Longimicrobiales bacterium]|nr:type II toxin-antitoxin system VapC family toxin [Longimicrobiales bacterium]
MIVVDTNVVVYLLTGGERGTAAARLFRQDPVWAAPGILPSELRNVLAGLVRRGHLGLDDALAVDADATDVLGDRIADVPGPTVLRIAVECGLSAYDAEFVALARALGVRLVTADGAILAGAPDVAERLPEG